jgi:hypothetical protein
MEETGTPLPDYLTLFRTRRAELWGEERQPLDYADTVAATWSLALEQVKGGPGRLRPPLPLRLSGPG